MYNITYYVLICQKITRLKINLTKLNQFEYHLLTHNELTIR